MASIARIATRCVPRREALVVAVSSLVCSFKRAVVECAEGKSGGVGIAVEVEVALGKGGVKISRRREQCVPHRPRATYDGVSVVTRDWTRNVVAEMKTRSFSTGVHRESKVDVRQSFWHDQHLEYCYRGCEIPALHLPSTEAMHPMTGHIDRTFDCKRSGETPTSDVC